jgi:hypothetical protein
MHVTFVLRSNGPERLVCEAELVFDTGPLAGTKLVGFSVWRSPDGEAYVTFPSRTVGAGCERTYFELLRSSEGGAGSTRRVKEYILEEFARSGSSEAAPS